MKVFFCCAPITNPLSKHGITVVAEFDRLTDKLCEVLLIKGGIVVINILTRASKDYKNYPDYKDNNNIRQLNKLKSFSQPLYSQIHT